MKPLGRTEESAIGDGDAMGVAGQVFEDLLGTPEGRFGVNSPFGATQLGPQVGPGDWAGEGLEVSVQAEFSLPSSVVEESEKAAAEEAAQDAHRQEEARAAVDPAALVG